MRRTLAAILALCLCMALFGCAKKPDGSDKPTDSPGPTKTPMPTYTPIPSPSRVPTATPAPVPVIRIQNYKYASQNSAALGITSSFPSHWRVSESAYTLSFTQPVDMHHFPARAAITVSSINKVLSKDALAKEARSAAAIIGRQYEHFEILKPGTHSGSMLKTNGWCLEYAADYSSFPIKGYIMMVNLNKQIYMFHFQSAKEDYIDFKPVIEKIRKGLKRYVAKATPAPKASEFILIPTLTPALSPPPTLKP